MTTVTDRPRSRSSAASVLNGSLPQVNLLPPEVRAARGLQRTKRWLLVSLGVTVVVCAGALGLSLISSATAKSELSDAQNETSRLNAEQAKYAEVPQVLGALSSATSARALGMSTEVQWKPYLDAITAVLPAGVSIDSWGMSGATPMVLAPPPTDPLQQASVGQVTFTARSLTVPDSSAMVDALNSIPGFQDAWVSSVSVGDGEGGAYFTVSATVQVSDAAYSKRFTSTDGKN
ncbi:PilN domain-containing protein [Cellulomonas sp. McL0617]|uniref:PilN domain-containing protein n=1 Tax=Cellulomonas sp. McL0617 TaxID=3415675 RepID=UPI003CF9853F